MLGVGGKWSLGLGETLVHVDSHIVVVFGGGGGGGLAEVVSARIYLST